MFGAAAPERLGLPLWDAVKLVPRGLLAHLVLSCPQQGPFLLSVVESIVVLLDFGDVGGGLGCFWGILS